MDQAVDRRAFLVGAGVAAVGAGLLAACGKDDEPGPTPDPKPGPQPIPVLPKGFSPVHRAEDAGFFCLHAAHNGELWAGTYGNPHVWSSPDGLSNWHRIDERINRAGESVFDMTNFEGTTFAATESLGRFYRYMGGGIWETVFRAGGDWNNSYSIVDAGGWVMTAFNEYPQNKRSLVFQGQNIKGEHSPGTQRTKTLNGIHHMHLGYLPATGIYFNGLWAHQGGSGVWRMAPDMQSHTELIRIPDARFPSRMSRIGDELWFAVEGTGKVYSVKGDAVTERGQIGETGLLQRVREHKGGIYVMAGKGWRSTSGKASLWCLNAPGVVKVAEFDEPEGWDLLSYKDRLYVCTRAEGGHGRIYRENL